jgi:hypothetical protein
MAAPIVYHNLEDVPTDQLMDELAKRKSLCPHLDDDDKLVCRITGTMSIRELLLLILLAILLTSVICHFGMIT